MHMRTILRETSVYIHLPPHRRLLPFYGCSASPTSASITLGYCKNGNLYDYLEAHPEATLCQRDDLSLRIIDFGGSAIDGDIPLAAEAEGYFLPHPPPWECTKDTDIFALGSTFYHILTGHRPHQDRAPQDDITASFERKEYAADLQDLLISDIILRCWKSEHRYAVDVMNELIPLMDQFRPEAKQDDEKNEKKVDSQSG
ncbi:hypothetical protein SCUCBS95973_003794 [Sporothrix curviconia]|uniref:Protein kinase domain-containing protein n=1 Tax=Sporothrix curviconia TaxID=1260050 RepID=A0ABP0BIB1_9PEZI